MFTGAFFSPLLLGPIFCNKGAQTLCLLAAVGWLLIGLATAVKVPAGGADNNLPRFSVVN